MHQERCEASREAMQARIEALYDEWGLDEEEHQTLNDAREEILAHARELREQEFENREEKRDAWLEIRSEHREALADILNDEPLAELRDVMKLPHNQHTPPRR